MAGGRVGNKTEKYIVILDGLFVLTPEQISAIFKVGPEEFIRFFVNLTYNLTVAGTIPLCVSKKFCKNLKKDFGSSLLKLNSASFTINQKRGIFVKNPKLVVKLAHCVKAVSGKTHGRNADGPSVRE
jgi:hypothetical protein